MTIFSESVSLRVTGELVDICYSSVVKNAGGVHPSAGSLWVERASLGWLQSAIQNAVDDTRAEKATLSVGNDNLRVVVGGHEAEPYVNVFNKRLGDVAQAGTYWIGPSRTFATTLIDEIKNLGT